MRCRTANNYIAPSTIEMRRRFNAPQGAVAADPSRIHQVLMILCTNAVHAMREQQGILEVIVGPREFSASDAAQNPDIREGAHLQLTVRDTGDGIDPAVRDRIFDPSSVIRSPSASAVVRPWRCSGKARNNSTW